MTTKTLPDFGELSRRRIIVAALNLFAEHGLDAVSMRMINRAAGHRNNSALHYHFGNKQGLFESIVAFVQGWFDDARESALKNVEEKAAEGNLTVRDVARAFLVPYVKLLEDEEWGFPAIRFLARMEFEESADMHAILNQHAEPFVQRLQPLLEITLPHLSESVRNLRFKHFVSSTMQGLAEYKGLNYSYMGNIEVNSYRELAELYLDYASAGLAAPIGEKNGFE